MHGMLEAAAFRREACLRAALKRRSISEPSVPPSPKVARTEAPGLDPEEFVRVVPALTSDRKAVEKANAGASR